MGSEAGRVEYKFSLASAIIYAIAVITLMATGVWGFQSLQSYRASARQTQIDQAILRDTRAVMSGLKDAETGQRGYVITRSEPYLAPYESGVRDTNAALDSLERSARGQGLDADVSELKRLARLRLSILEEVLSLTKIARAEDARALVASGRGKASMDMARTQVTQMERSLEARLEKGRTVGAVNFGGLTIALALTVLVAILLVTIVYARGAREQKLAKQLAIANQENANFLTAALDALSAHVAVLDAKGEVLVVNERWREFVAENGDGIADHFLGRSFVESCDPSTDPNNERVGAGIREVLEGRQDVYSLEYPCQTNNKLHWFEMRVTRFFEKGEPRTVVAHIDVTDRKEAELLLIEAEAHQAAIIGSSLDCIIACDQNSIITDFNRPAEETFGYRREEALGRELAELIIPARLRESHRHGMARFLRTKESEVIGRRVVLTGVRSNGEEFPVELSIAAVPTSAGVLFNAFLRDISDQKRLEDDLRRTAADLSEANRRKTEFLAILAHELRNPLAPVRNALDLMRITDFDRKLLPELIGMLERQVDQVTRLVDDLLDVGRITQGKIELKPELIDINEVVAQAVEASQPGYTAKGVELLVVPTAEPLMVHADRARMAQVISNLLVNASKFTPPGGHVQLDVRQDENHAVVTVKDDGIGIAPGKIPYLFDLFMQVDHALSKTESGLGIGLTLVKNLVEMHGGEVFARSEGLQQGAEFSVNLPRAIDPGVDFTVAPELDPIVKTDMKILVIDDNLDAARVLSLLLEIEGFTVATAHDGVEGLVSAEEHGPGLVFCDIGLPGLTGYEVARAIRAQPWGTDMKLVALTGWGQGEDRARTHEAGFDLHLVKPVDRSTLLKAIADLTSRD